MMNFAMNETFMDKCFNLRSLRIEVEETRNILIASIIDKMEIGKSYTVEDLSEMCDSEMSVEMLSGAFQSLANCPEFEKFEHFGSRPRTSSLRSFIGSGRIANGQPAYKRTFFVECDEYGNVVPNGKRTCHSSPRNTYIRQK